MRFEHKYVVPMERLDALRHDVLPYTTLDINTIARKDHQYTVRSIYFDTARLDAFREKLEGIKVRRKLRVRSYNSVEEGSLAYLEIKSKMEQRGTKCRAPLNTADLPAFFRDHDSETHVLPGRNKSAAVENARRFLFHYIRSAMKPVVLVTYEREAFQGRFDPNLRITFDKHVRFLALPALDDLYREEGLTHLAPRFFIVEIKFGGGYAPWLQSIITKHCLTRRSISKYGSCVAASGVPGKMGCAPLIGRAAAGDMLQRTEAAA